MVLVALVAAQLGEQLLQGRAVPCYLPWLPTAAAAGTATLLWARIAARARPAITAGYPGGGRRGSSLRATPERPAVARLVGPPREGESS